MECMQGSRFENSELSCRMLVLADVQLCKSRLLPAWDGGGRYNDILDLSS